MEGSLPDNAQSLRPRQREAVGRIAALIVTNASYFSRSFYPKTIRASPQGFNLIAFPLDSSEKCGGNGRLSSMRLTIILSYFLRPRSYLECFSADRAVDQSLGNLVETAMMIVAWRASLRHDLAGRIYHRLLDEAKYLGAYYTSIPTATLLLKLALQPDRYDMDWTSPEAQSLSFELQIWRAGPGPYSCQAAAK